MESQNELINSLICIIPLLIIAGIAAVYRFRLGKRMLQGYSREEYEHLKENKGYPWIRVSAILAMVSVLVISFFIVFVSFKPTFLFSAVCLAIPVVFGVIGIGAGLYLYSKTKSKIP